MQSQPKAAIRLDLLAQAGVGCNTRSARDFETVFDLISTLSDFKTAEMVSLVFDSAKQSKFQIILSSEDFKDPLVYSIDYKGHPGLLVCPFKSFQLEMSFSNFEVLMDMLNGEVTIVLQKAGDQVEVLLCLANKPPKNYGKKASAVVQEEPAAKPERQLLLLFTFSGTEFKVFEGLSCRDGEEILMTVSPKGLLKVGIPGISSGLTLEASQWKVTSEDLLLPQTQTFKVQTSKFLNWALSSDGHDLLLRVFSSGHNFDLCLGTFMTLSEWEGSSSPTSKEEVAGHEETLSGGMNTHKPSRCSPFEKASEPVTNVSFAGDLQTVNPFSIQSKTTRDISKSKPNQAGSKMKPKDKSIKSAWFGTPMKQVASPEDSEVLEKECLLFPKNPSVQCATKKGGPMDYLFTQEK